MSMVDTANGILGRISPADNPKRWIYSNPDLKIHLHHQPAGQWLGLKAVQQYGTHGIGLTSSWALLGVPSRF